MEYLIREREVKLTNKESAAGPLYKTMSIRLSKGCRPEEGDKESGTTIM